MILIFLSIVLTCILIYIAYKLATLDTSLLAVIFYISVVFAVFIGVSAITMTCMLISKTVTEPSELVAYQVRYESIMHQIDMYENGDYSKRDLYAEIEDWNTELTRIKKLRENFFIKDFQYNVDDFQLIEFPDS